MEQSAKTGLDYAGGKITSLFFRIFFPTLMGMFFNTLLNLADGIFIGNGVGADGLAAVNIIAPLYMVSTGAGLMFGIGASVTAGILLSQGQERRACVAITQALAICVLIITAILTAVFMFPDAVIRLLGSSDTLAPYAIEYLSWLAPAFFGLVFQCIGLMVIRLDGSPKYAMMTNVVPAITNIVLDYVFIFPLGMGMKGAAIATSISCMIGVSMVLLYFFRFSYVLKLVWSPKHFGRNTGRQAYIGSSAFITEIALSVMMLTGNYVFSHYYGNSGIAAFSIACYLFPLMFMVSNSVAQSAQPIISYNYGTATSSDGTSAAARENAMGRVRGAFRLSIAVATVCGVIIWALLALASKAIVGMFIDPESTAGQLAVHGLPVFGLCSVLFAENINFIGFYQSTEKPALAVVYTLMRGIVFLVPSFILLPLVSPVWGMWAAIPVSETATFIIISTCYLLTRKNIFAPKHR